MSEAQTTSLSARQLSEREEDAQPVLLPVFGAGPVPTPQPLFLGNRVAAEDAALLAAYGVTSTLNLAVNITIPPLRLADGTEVRRTQIGLIDGVGNVASHLLAGVLALHGILHQASPGKPNYPRHRAGGLLVHCRGGRSRSVITLGLFLHWALPGHFPSLETALAHLRVLRGIGPEHPGPALMALAGDLVATPGLAALCRLPGQAPVSTSI